MKQKKKKAFSVEDVLRRAGGGRGGHHGRAYLTPAGSGPADGDVNAKGCLDGIRAIAREGPTRSRRPAGISRETALLLKGTGIRGMDVSGWEAPVSPR